MRKSNTFFINKLVLRWWTEFATAILREVINLNINYNHSEPDLEFNILSRCAMTFCINFEKNVHIATCMKRKYRIQPVQLYSTFVISTAFNFTSSVTLIHVLHCCTHISLNLSHSSFLFYNVHVHSPSLQYFQYFTDQSALCHVLYES